MLRLASEQVGPVRVIGQDADILVDGSLDAFLKCVHFTRDALSRLTSRYRSSEVIHELPESLWKARAAGRE
jgi:hypothetical protein